jgi:hypothetical protein
MNLLRTLHFERNYAKASQQVQRAFDKQSLLLLQNLHHPSLRAKAGEEVLVPEVLPVSFAGPAQRCVTPSVDRNRFPTRAFFSKRS